MKRNSPAWEGTRSRAQEFVLGLRQLQLKVQIDPAVRGEINRTADLVVDLLDMTDCNTAAPFRNTATCNRTEAGKGYCYACALAEEQHELRGETKRADDAWDALEAALQLLDLFRRRR